MLLNRTKPVLDDNEVVGIRVQTESQKSVENAVKEPCTSQFNEGL